MAAAGADASCIGSPVVHLCCDARPQPCTSKEFNLPDPLCRESTTHEPLWTNHQLIAIMSANSFYFAGKPVSVLQAPPSKFAIVISPVSDSPVVWRASTTPPGAALPTALAIANETGGKTRKRGGEAFSR